MKSLPQKYINSTRLIRNRNLLLKLLPKNSVVMELGTEHGYYSNKILKICKPKKLYLVDIIIKDKLRKKFQNYIVKNIVSLHQLDSIEMLKKIPNCSIDWIYIDTDHTYEQTKKELILASRKVKENGLICGHDYIDHSYVENTHYGVIQAVNEFCIQNNWDIIYLTNEPHRYLSYVLKKA